MTLSIIEQAGDAERTGCRRLPLQQGDPLLNCPNPSARLCFLRQAQLELLRGRVTASTPPSKANRAKWAKIAGAANTTLPLFTADPKAPYAHPFYWAPFVLIGNPL